MRQGEAGTGLAPFPVAPTPATGRGASAHGLREPVSGLASAGPTLQTSRHSAVSCRQPCPSLGPGAAGGERKGQREGATEEHSGRDGQETASGWQRRRATPGSGVLLGRRGPGPGAAEPAPSTAGDDARPAPGSAQTDAPARAHPGALCGQRPSPDRLQQAGDGDGDGARPGARWPRPARAAHSPGMGDEVIHGDLDCFPRDDLFECFEDEFIVKGIWRNQSVKGFLDFKMISAAAMHRGSLQVCVFRRHVTP